MSISDTSDTLTDYTDEHIGHLRHSPDHTDEHIGHIRHSPDYTDEHIGCLRHSPDHTDEHIGHVRHNNSLIKAYHWQHFLIIHINKMKTTILTVFVSLFVIGGFFTSCNTPAQKVENAENNVTEAKKELVAAKEEYLVDIENQREEAIRKIALNNQLMVDFRANLQAKKEAKVEYDKKILLLEQRNNNLKLKIEEYRATGKENWETFKVEYNKEMEDLAQSLRDLTTLHKPK